MKAKKIQVKLLLSQESTRKMFELQKNEPLARTCGRILEACVDYDGDFLTLLYLISHHKDKIVRE